MVGLAARLGDIMAHPKYSLTFDFRGQKLRLVVYRLFHLFGWSISLTKLEKVK